MDFEVLLVLEVDHEQPLLDFCERSFRAQPNAAAG